METSDNKTQLVYTENSIYHLKELRKWTFFISILGFIMIGICIVIIPIAFFSNFSNNSSTSQSLSLLPLLLVMAVYFFPIYYLFKFSSYSKKAISNSDTNAFEIAFRYCLLYTSDAADE